MQRYDSHRADEECASPSWTIPLARTKPVNWVHRRLPDNKNLLTTPMLVEDRFMAKLEAR